MKKWLTILIVCCIAIYLAQGNPATEKYSVSYVAKSGETLDEIIGRWYEKDERGLCWDEFRTKNWKINAHLQNSRRCLKPGDLVTIEWYERKKTDGREN